MPQYEVKDNVLTGPNGFSVNLLGGRLILMIAELNRLASRIEELEEQVDDLNSRLNEG